MNLLHPKDLLIKETDDSTTTSRDPCVQNIVPKCDNQTTVVVESHSDRRVISDRGFNYMGCSQTYRINGPKSNGTTVPLSSNQISGRVCG